MIRLFVVALTFGLFAGGALAQPAFGPQQEAYQFQLPAGWTPMEAGEGFTFGSPDGTAALMFMPVQGRANLDIMADQIKTMFETRMGLREPQLTPPQRGKSGNGEFIMQGGSYAMGENSGIYIIIYSYVENDIFGSVAFLTGKHDSYTRLAPAAISMFGSLHLTNKAEQIAAANESAVKAALGMGRPATPPTQQPASQPYVQNQPMTPSAPQSGPAPSAGAPTPNGSLNDLLQGLAGKPPQ
jgi:hypothetical protein